MEKALSYILDKAVNTPLMPEKCILNMDIKYTSNQKICSPQVKGARLSITIECTWEG